MDNIIDYVKLRGTESFADAGFRTEDAIVLCLFSYLDFDRLVPGMKEKSISIRELNESPDKDSLFSNPKYEKNRRALFEAMLNSVRFGELKLACYINRIDIEYESQFAAVTFMLPEQNFFLAFRGTDETMVGWQEDFGLALKKPILGQQLSAKYINDVSDRFPGKFMIGGHSKGGNLAMYSAMCANVHARDRISRVYCFDAPGFRPEFLEEKNYEEMKDRVVKVIPRSSIVGMLLGSANDQKIVESYSIGASQHDMFSWKTRLGRLIETTLSDQHKKSLEIMNTWILSLDDEHLERFVKFACEILGSSEATTTTEFKKNFIKNSASMIKAASGADEETKKFLTMFAKSYFEMAWSMIVNPKGED